MVLKESGGVYGGAMTTVQSHAEAVRNGGQELVTEDPVVLDSVWKQQLATNIVVQVMYLKEIWDQRMNIVTFTLCQ